MNVIVISLKDEFYAHSDALIGVCPDNANGKKLSHEESSFCSGRKQFPKGISIFKADPV